MLDILITGASGGIGRALARDLERRGNRVFRLGRRPSKDSRYARIDFSETASARKVVAFLAEHGVKKLDWIVHNAASGYYGNLRAHGVEDACDLVRVNLEIPIQLTRELFPLLKASRKPKVAFVSSVAASLPCPDYGVYAATKAGLNGFARSLAAEWKKSPEVQILVPGATNSGMHERLGIDKKKMNWDRFPSAESTSAAMIKALESGRPVTTLGWVNRTLRGLGRYLPGALDAVLSADLTGGGASARPNFLGMIAVVTGAGSGIGLACSKEFARRGFRVLGVDVDGEALQGAERDVSREGGVFVPLEADLCAPAGRKRLLDVLRESGPADVFIHNAGISWVGPFEKAPEKEIHRVLGLNFEAPIALTLAALQEELVSPRGSWVFLSSLSNFTGYPGAAVYAGTKEGLAAFARNLRASNARDFHVMTVYPGPTRTPHARRYSPDNSKESKRMAPERVAREIFEGVRDGRRYVTPGWGNRLAVLGGLCAPTMFDYLMRKILYEKIVTPK